MADEMQTSLSVTQDAYIENQLLLQCSQHRLLPAPHTTSESDKEDEDEWSLKKAVLSLPNQSKPLPEPHCCWSFSTTEECGDHFSILDKKLRNGTKCFPSITMEKDKIRVYLNVDSNDGVNVTFHYAFITRYGFRLHTAEKKCCFSRDANKCWIVDINKNEMKYSVMTLGYTILENEDIDLNIKKELKVPQNHKKRLFVPPQFFEMSD